MTVPHYIYAYKTFDLIETHKYPQNYSLPFSTSSLEIDMAPRKDTRTTPTKVEADDEDVCNEQDMTIINQHGFQVRCMPKFTSEFDPGHADTIGH
jgi:hypothetical protein